jgi:U3 small nucleolar RNA-associated protein 10
VLRKIIGEHCLQSANMELRVMALLHLATSAEVIGEAIIPVLPVAVLKAIEYLKDSIKNGAEGERLHNAVYTFFASLLLQIPFMMTGEYLDHLLEASYESASSNLSAECEGSRIETLQMIPKHVDPVECFAALERTWDTALVEGAEVSCGPKACAAC